MVRERLRDMEQHDFARRIGRVRIRRNLVLRDHRVAVQVRVVHVEAPLLCEPGRKSEPQQTLFAASARLAADVQKWLRRKRAITQDAHNPILLHQEQASRPVAGVLDICRRIDARRHWYGLNLLREDKLRERNPSCDKHPHGPRPLVFILALLAETAESPRSRELSRH